MHLHEIAFRRVIDDDGACEIPIEPRKILDVNTFHWTSMVPVFPKSANRWTNSQCRVKIHLRSMMWAWECACTSISWYVYGILWGTGDLHRREINLTLTLVQRWHQLCCRPGKGEQIFWKFGRIFHINVSIQTWDQCLFDRILMHSKICHYFVHTSQTQFQPGWKQNWIMNAQSRLQ